VHFPFPADKRCVQTSGRVLRYPLGDWSRVTGTKRGICWVSSIGVCCRTFCRSFLFLCWFSFHQRCVVLLVIAAGLFVVAVVVFLGNILLTPLGDLDVCRRYVVVFTFTAAAVLHPNFGCYFNLACRKLGMLLDLCILPPLLQFGWCPSTGLSSYWWGCASVSP